MLLSLHIKNFAIIDDLRVSFEEGLNVLSGETGAGKSIIIQALQLILGERASADTIRRGEEYAEVKAVFHIDHLPFVKDVMAELGVAEGEELLIHRMVNHSGRNKILINGEPATLVILSRLGRVLVDVVSQHAQQNLFQEETHIDILDDFGEFATVKQHYQTLFDKYHKTFSALQELRQRHEAIQEREEFLKFQIKEVRQSNLQAGEEEELNQEKAVVRHAAQLGASVQAGQEGLSTGEESVEDKLMGLIPQLQESARIDENLQAVVEQLESALVQVQESARELSHYADTLQFDPDRLQFIEDRLALINQIKRKHGGDFAEILQKIQEWETELDSLENFSDQEQELVTTLQQSGKVLLQSSRELTKQRHQAAQKLHTLVEHELHQLGMNQAEFRVTFRPRKDKGYEVKKGVWLDQSGDEEAWFEIAPNVGEGLKSLVKIASGGEMARILLALKTVLGGRRECAVCVFDEVDSGIGGGVAEIVGRQLATIAERRQVLCITHLPQIACFGKQHYNITKQSVDGRTQTQLVRLSHQEREEEIARMLGGMVITEKTMAHAREMLKSCQN
jgi:DNA repair protein RecN (Recombination protein N)